MRGKESIGGLYNIMFQFIVILGNRVCEMFLSLARHFFRRTMGPSPDILGFRRTFLTCATKMKAFLKCQAICNFFARHFAQFAGYLNISPDMSVGFRVLCSAVTKTVMTWGVAETALWR